MGFGGNAEPSFLIPTAVASADSDIVTRPGGKEGIGDMEYFVGEEAVSTKMYQTNYPIQHGKVENWNNMERLWQRCFYEYLRVEPDEHVVMLTEPPMNPPENREYMAEVMFETYNVPGMYIAVQAMLALAASWPARAGTSSLSHRDLTGTVIDIGDGVTHVVPVVDGYVLGGSIRSMELAGKDITKFIQGMIRDRGEVVPPEDIFEVAKRVKERDCYVCKDMVKEFSAYDKEPSKYFKKYTGVNSRTKAEFTVDVGYEAFLGPELFFNPEIFPDAKSAKPLSQIVDESISSAAMDVKRDLYRNIVLSGGSTLFKNFHRRLRDDINKRVQTRYDDMLARHAGRIGGAVTSAGAGTGRIDVEVVRHDMQRYAVWFGGSVVSEMPGFHKLCHTRAQYMEEGPRIARHNAVFQATL